MKRNKKRSIDEYKKAGAEMRLFKQLGTKLAVDISAVLPAKETDKLLRALKRIDEVCSHAEDCMFADYPEVSNEYLDVFYGSVNDKPRNSIDEEVITLAREVADGLFQ